jgi:hypothetical protein
LYHLRLELESLSLPPVGTPGRLSADLGRLANRLAEAQAATAGGDTAAANDALGAYQDTLVDGVAAAGDSAADRTNLDAALGTQLAVLNRLLANTPAQARAGLEHAIAEVGRARAAIDHGARPENAPDKGGGASPGNSAPGKGNANGGSTGANGNGGAPKGNGKGNGETPGASGNGNGNGTSPGAGGNGNRGTPKPKASGSGSTPGANGNGNANGTSPGVNGNGGRLSENGNGNERR